MAIVLPKILLVLFLQVGLVGAAAALGDEWEALPDGSLGQVSEFHGVGGLAATAPLWLVEHQAAQESYAPPVNGMYAQSL